MFVECVSKWGKLVMREAVFEQEYVRRNGVSVCCVLCSTRERTEKMKCFFCVCFESKELAIYFFFSTMNMVLLCVCVCVEFHVATDCVQC